MKVTNDIKINSDKNVEIKYQGTVVSDKGKITFYFRSRNTMKNATFKLFIDDQKVYEKNYNNAIYPSKEYLGKFDLNQINNGITIFF